MARTRRVKATKKSKPNKASAAPRVASSVDRPTPEMEARVKFDLGQVTTETGLPFGFAYRRKPLIETMALTGALSPDEANALRFYRTAHDRSERSATRSCLDISGGGMSGSPSAVLSATPSTLEAKRKLRTCEAGLGPLLTTMRGVVLDDKSFSQIAMDRYGSRVSTSRSGKPTFAPRSGRHREAVRQEFIAGLKILTDGIRRLITTGSVEEVWVVPLDDGSATIRRGWAAPQGLYRCWGDDVLIDRVMSELRDKHGAALEFKSADHAIDALQKVEEGRLRHLEQEELAA